VTAKINCRNSTVAKITIDDAIEIRRRFSVEKITKKTLGEKYGITGCHVGGIVSYKSWA
jgi:hypothetical protein